MKLAKCPICSGESLTSCTVQGDGCCDSCGLAAPEKTLRRLARLVRKGRMFEWLERDQRIRKDTIWEATDVGVVLTGILGYAREWWRRRRAK